MSNISGDGVRALGSWPDPFGWSRRRVDGADVIWLAGELDFDTAAELRLRLIRVAESSTAATIVLDLSDVCFMDGKCAGVIVAAWEAARCHGRQLEVDGLHGTPEFVFDVLGLEPILARRTETSEGGRDSG